MSEETSFLELTRALAEDQEFRKALTARLQARIVDEETMARLVAYARSRQTTMAHAMARRVLTEAGVSWESL